MTTRLRVGLQRFGTILVLSAAIALSFGLFLAAPTLIICDLIKRAFPTYFYGMYWCGFAAITACFVYLFEAIKKTWHPRRRQTHTL